MFILRKYSYLLTAILIIIFVSMLARVHFTQSLADQSPAEQNKPLPGIPILTYHKVNPDPKTGGTGLRVTPADFEWEMKYLKDHGYHTVDLGAVIDHFQKGRKLPDKPVVITFDDGYEDNYRYAYPILKKYGFTATIFVVTNIVGGINEYDYQAHIQPKNKMLTWQEIKEMSDNGITIGAHTLDHVHFKKISQAEAKRQIFESKRRLEEALGKDVQYFCYPYGEYNQAVVEMVKESGYRAATSTQRGLVQTATDPFILKRISYSPHTDHKRFIKELHKYD